MSFQSVYNRRMKEKAMSKKIPVPLSEVELKAILADIKRVQSSSVGETEESTVAKLEEYLATFEE